MTKRPKGSWKRKKSGSAIERNLWNRLDNAVTFEGSTTIRTEIVEHGGGCRKSSPPGQCCHLETRTGVVHCH